MGKTSFSGPVFSGGVPLLPNRFGWKYDTDSWFVDGTAGSDGNSGKEADKAFSTVGQAISVAGAYDVIYILDKGLSGTDPNPYQESTTDLSVSYSLNNLAIIGVPHNIHQLYGLQLKHVSSSSNPVISIYAPFVAVENLDFNKTGSGVGSCIYFRDDGDTSYQAQGSSVFNCHLRNADLGSTAATAYGGIQVNGGWYYTFKDCFFMDCRNGVNATSGTSTVKGVQVLGCTFNGTETNIDTGIHFAGTVYNTLIDGCNFAMDVPASTVTSALTAYIYDLVSDPGSVTNCTFATDDASCNATGTSEIVVSTNTRISACYDEAGLVARA